MNGNNLLVEVLEQIGLDTYITKDKIVVIKNEDVGNIYETEIDLDLFIEKLEEALGILRRNGEQ